MIRLAKKSDKQKIIEIITDAFDQNPSVNFVVKQDVKRKNRIRELARYAFMSSLYREGVFISTDNNSVAICYHYNKKGTIKDYYYQLRLALKSIGITRVTKVLRREKTINKKRPQNRDYLYFWFFGSNNEGRINKSTVELKDFIFSYADKAALPIYLETSVDKNKRVYERYGFKVYNTWDMPDGNTLWFMRRNPTSMP